MDLIKAQKASVRAARGVGELMRRHLHSRKRTSSVTRFDIKLQLDVQAQRFIEKMLISSFPSVPILGEEGDAGDIEADYRWVVDPIDGTVNFSYGIPHACVSIALQKRAALSKPTTKSSLSADSAYQTLVGVVYDPFCDELWTAIRGRPARLNGRVIRVSNRRKLNDAMVSIGFAKSHQMIDATLPYFDKLVYRVRKIRVMGAAALGLAYVATGRFDAYIEQGIRLWDIAAGGLLVECAGGEFWSRPISGRHAYRMVASNGRLRASLRLPH